MNIKEIYNENEEITFENYLNKNGITDIEEYLNPTSKYLDDCFKYNNIRSAIQEIDYWLKTDDSKIFIIQDGDVDGICSTVILYQYLKALKEDWNISILIHTSKQRGLDDEDIMKRIRQERPDLVIVPDAGTNNYIQAEELKDLCIGLLVLDHHDYAIPTEENPNNRPINQGILINNQDKNSNVQKCGSGALVTHKFLEALDDYYGNNWANWFIDIVALSLVSDSMDMTAMENRVYYHYGLEKRQNINNNFLGALFDTFIGNVDYTQRDISFKIIPKLNSICRCENMELKQRIILSFIGQDNIDEILDICKQSHQNQINTVTKIIKDNEQYINKDNKLVVFCSDDIPRSYSGLVSGKIMNLCDGKPTIVGSIKDNMLIGSLRSPIPLRQSLDSNNLVEWCNGHEQSAGICIKEENIQPLIDYYNTLELSYEPCETVLKSYSINSIPKRFYGLFEPYGALWTNCGLPKPKFHIKNININSQDIKLLGANERTVKIHTEYADIMIFNVTNAQKDELCIEKNKKISIELVGTLNINVWNNKKTNQIIVENFEVKPQQSKRKEDIF